VSYFVKKFVFFTKRQHEASLYHSDGGKCKAFFRHSSLRFLLDLAFGMKYNRSDKSERSFKITEKIYGGRN
jgi:hypothetical protein